jgi:hypothetical protein
VGGRGNACVKVYSESQEDNRVRRKESRLVGKVVIYSSFTGLNLLE